MHKAALLKILRFSLRFIAPGALVVAGSMAAEAPTAPAAQVAPISEQTRTASLEDLKSRAKEILKLEVEGDATLVGAPRPVSVEFKGSNRVAILVAEDLSRRGVPAVAGDASAPATLKLSARVSLQGPEGRMAFDLGTMFEKILAGKSAAELAQIDPAQNAVFGTTAYLRTAALERIGLFDPFLYRYFTAVSITDALGLHAAANKAMTGDARGVCLINCDNWKNTLHWVIVDATVISGGQERTARSVLRAWMTEIDPQTTFDIAYQALLQDRLLKGEK